MQDQVLNTFRFVVGAARPIRLAVRGPSGGPPDIVEVDSPFAVLGRSGGCHIHLPAEQVGYRHAYLQVIGGRIACIDLLSTSGIQWDGATRGPWLSPDHRLSVGPYTIQLFDDGWVYDPALASPLDFRPRSDRRPEYGALPDVHLELISGPAAGKSWPINRVLTLVGRDERCRITCADDEISKVHCSLLLAPSGLWVIDLLGRNGVLVNGERLACAYLQENSELQVGKYKLRVKYPQHAGQTIEPPTGREGAGGSAGPSAPFLTRHHKVFPIEIAGDTLIVKPQGDIRDFFYQDIHQESNQVVRLIQKPEFRRVVVDFSDVPLVGSVVLDAVAGFCRNARGGAFLCAASPELLAVLQTINFPSIWPYFPTREEALRSPSTAATSVVRP